MAFDTALLRCKSCNSLNRVPVKKLSQNPICGKCKALLDFPFQSVSATTASFDQELASWLETALVVFWAKENELWRMVEPAVADIAFSQAGKLKVIKVDAGAEPGLIDRLSIQTEPTFLAFRDGKQIGRLDGAPRNAAELLPWVRGFMN
jgi:thioredoxin 2